MRRTSYPICEECGDEINPNKYDDCDQYFISNDRVLCKECVKKEIEEMMQYNFQQVAEALGIYTVEVE